MTLAFHRAVPCLVVAAALAVSACSSSSSGGGGGASSTPGGSSSTPPATSTAPATLDAAAKAEISTAYKVFFDTKTALDASVAVLQHGAKFRQALNAESNSPSAQNITAKVSAVTAQSANVAVVTFTIKSGGSVLLPNTHGFAVLEGGKWKVAAQTFCNLLTLEGTAPAVCKDTTITALPN
jgi:hypothetical protein